MTASERRKIMCSVTFHVIAITCVVWSLYVLIDRTAEEIKQGQLSSTNPNQPLLTHHQTPLPPDHLHTKKHFVLLLLIQVVTLGLLHPH